MFLNVEELFVCAVITGVSYSQAQLLDRALDNIKQTGLYMMAFMDWNRYDPANKTWEISKAHFVQAYELRLNSGPMSGAAVYLGATAAYSNDDSLGNSSGSLAQMQVANNVNARAPTNNMSAISTGTNELRHTLLATQQQLAVLAGAVNNSSAPAMPAWNQATISPQFAAAQPPPLNAVQYHANAALPQYMPNPT